MSRPGTSAIRPSVVAAGGSFTGSGQVRFADDVEPVLASLTVIHSEAVALKVDIGRFRPYTSHESRRTAEQILIGGLVGEVFDWLGNMIGYRIEAWDQDLDLVRRNNDLIARVASNVAAYQQAERDCANRINALFGGTQYVAWSASMGTANLPGNVYGYGAGSLPTIGLPWGDPVDRTDSGQTKAVRFFGNMLDGIAASAVETVVALVMLPVQLTGLAGPQQQKQAAYGLLNLAVIIGSKPYQDTQVFLYDPVTDTVTRGNRYLYTMELGKAFLAWDEWGKDPGTAAGTVVFNIGSFFIPGGAAVKGGSAAAKAGAGARAVGTAAKAEEAAAAAARATAVARAAEEATAAARVTGVAGDITRTVDIVSDTTRTAIAASDTTRVADIVNDTTRTIDTASQTARTVDAVGDTARTADLVGDASKARAADTVSDLTSPQRSPHPVNVVDDAGVSGTGKGVDAGHRPQPEGVPRSEPGVSSTPRRAEDGTVGSQAGEHSPGGPGKEVDGGSTRPSADQPRGGRESEAGGGSPERDGGPRDPGGSDGQGGAPSVGDPTGQPFPDISDLAPLKPSSKSKGDLDAWADAVASRHAEVSANPLTADEVKAIHYYTTNAGYTEMNRFLRNPAAYSGDEAARIQRLIDDTVSGLDKLPEYHGNTFRGADLPDSVTAHWKPGYEGTTEAFWSTSTRPGTADSFIGNTYIEFEGRSGVDVSKLSYYDSESEVLIKPGTRFRVTKVVNESDFTHYLMEEIS